MAFPFQAVAVLKEAKSHGFAPHSFAISLKARFPEACDARPACPEKMS